MKELNWPTRLYILGMVILTAVLLGWQWSRQPLDLSTEQRLSSFLVGVFLVYLASTRPIELPRTAHISLGSVFGLAAICLFDPTFGILLYLIGLALAYSYNRLRRGGIEWRWYQILFSIAAQTLALDLGGELYLYLHRGDPNPIISWQNASAFVLGGALFVLLNGLLIAFVIGLSERINPMQVLLLNRQGSFLQFVSHVPLSGIIVILYQNRPWAVLLILLPLIAIHLSFEESALLRRHTRQTLQFIATLVDAREPFTSKHSRQVARYALTIAQAAQVPLPVQERIWVAATLHDLGKLSIPEKILLKAARLDNGEWDSVRTHPNIGASLVAGLSFLSDAESIIRCHHERFDGAGYPEGLSGEEIPLGARILAVADALDAITVDRPYRAASTWEAALQEIQDHSGTQFDPQVVAMTVQTEPKLKEIYLSAHAARAGV